MEEKDINDFLFIRAGKIRKLFLFALSEFDPIPMSAKDLRKIIRRIRNKDMDVSQVDSLLNELREQGIIKLYDDRQRSRSIHNRKVLQ